MQRVTRDELREHLDDYLRAVEGGETIEVCEGGREMATLVPPAPTANGAGAESSRPRTFADAVREAYEQLADLPPVDVDVVALLREDRDYR